jgi:hypothetical protein
LGAGSRGQLLPGGATRRLRRSLTCPDAVHQHPVTDMCFVRIEGVRGSNPLSSTQYAQVRGTFTVAWLVPNPFPDSKRIAGLAVTRQLVLALSGIYVYAKGEREISSSERRWPL